MKETNTIRGFWIPEPGRGEIRRGVLPSPGGDEIVVRALYSGISRGTESLVFRGEVPPSQFDAMRAPFQEGEFPAPVKYGYSSVARVEADPEPAPGRDSLVGRTVFCLFPHQDRYVVPASAVAPLPDGVPPDRAILAANVETAINSVWDGGAAPGDTIVVVGAGVVGLLIAWICRQIPGTQVTAVDPDPSRRAVAEALGVDLRSVPPGHGTADLVFHASGTPAGARSALEAAGREATVVEVSWFGTRMVPLPLGEGFHARRLTLRSSQVGGIPPARAPRWTHARRMALALELLRAPELDALISSESPFDDLPSVMERLAHSGEGTLCHRIRYLES